MWRNYFKIAFRNLLKQKGYSLINVWGLAIGLTCCTLILLFVANELRYDQSFKDSDRLYRVYLDSRINNKDFITAQTCEPMASAMQREIPEVEAATRINDYGNFMVRHGEKTFNEERFYLADSNVGQVLSLEYIEGDPDQALRRKNTLILTDAMAKKYFGTEHVLGKTLFIDNLDDFEITGVVKAYPLNSHFHFDFLATMASRPPESEGSWLSNNYFTYLKIREGASAEAAENKLHELLVRYGDPQLQKALGASFKQIEASGLRYKYRFQKVTDIHLHSQLQGELEPNGDIAYVYIFSIIAIFVLGIACINFMNLATARSARRAREVGVRKALGSDKTQLVQMFLFESILVSTLAMIFTFGLVELSLPAFNQFSGKELALSNIPWPMVLLGMITGSIGIGVLAGSYPAFFLSSFQPVRVLKGELSSGLRSGKLRSVLVITQFAVSITLIIGTIVVFRQLQYVQDKDLGFDKERLLVIDNMWLLRDNRDALKTELLTHSGIVQASVCGNIPGKNAGNSAYLPEGGDPSNPLLLYNAFADFNYVPTLGIEIKAGRNLSAEFPTDSNGALLINESAARLLGYQEPVGRKLMAFFGENNMRPVTIVGMVKDFHFQSLHQEIRPLVIRYSVFQTYMLLRIKGQIPEIIKDVEVTWNKFTGGQAFSYFFVDDNLNSLYKAENTIGKVFGLFATLGIFIACLGLLGLAAYTAEQRTKEIGVRKVMGASVPTLVGLLSKEFVMLVLIANIIAWPVAFYAMHRWLENFAYRVSLGLDVFLIGGFLALIIALSTVSYQAVKAATANPVDALKYE